MERLPQYEQVVLTFCPFQGYFQNESASSPQGNFKPLLLPVLPGISQAISRGHRLDNMAPVGREFGSPDYDRLMQEGFDNKAGVFTPGLAEALKKKVAKDGHMELPGD